MLRYMKLMKIPYYYLGENMNIIVRKASSEDAEYIAKEIIKSSQNMSNIGLFDLIFNEEGTALEKKLCSLVVNKSDNLCQYKYFLIAESYGKKIGLIAGYEAKKMKSEFLLDAIRSDYEIDPSKCEVILNTYFSCYAPKNKNSWVLKFLSVVDDIDAFAVARALINKSLLNARVKGYRLGQSSIDIDNVELQEIYKDSSFSKEEEVKNEAFEDLFHSLGIVLYKLHL